MRREPFFKNSFRTIYNNQHSTQGNSYLIWYGYLMNVWGFIKGTKKDLHQIWAFELVQEIRKGSKNTKMKLFWHPSSNTSILLDFWDCHIEEERMLIYEYVLNKYLHYFCFFFLPEKKCFIGLAKNDSCSSRVG